MRNITVIVGASGAGKSTLARKLYADRFPLKPRSIVVDALGEYEFPSHPRLELPEEIAMTWPSRFVAEFIPGDLGLVYTYARTRGSCLILIEEFSLSWRNAEEELMDIFQRGRHYGIDLICVSQRAVDFPVDLRIHVTEVHAFEQRDPVDVERLKTTWGLECSGLPQFEFRSYYKFKKVNP